MPNAAGDPARTPNRAGRSDAAPLKRRAERKVDPVQSLARALGIVNCLAASGDGATLTEIAHQVGLSSSTVHRLLTTLEQERYVHFDAERRLWRVGVQAFVVGNVFLRARHLLGTVRPHMTGLMEESGETVNLAMEDLGEAIYLAQVECRQMMRAFARPGGKVPLHCSSVGKALLAEMSEAGVGKILHRRGMPQLTVKTICTTSALKADLALCRRRGYAVDDEEHAVGLRCIAAPIRHPRDGAIAAISISGPLARIPDDRIDTLGALVRHYANRIAASLGEAQVRSACG